jgi:hypothetical protein
MKRTPNAQPPTPNARWKKAAIFAAILASTSQVLAVDSRELAEAARPMEEGVPQVAVLRLRALLARDLGTEERREGTARLGEALLAAGETEEALKVLQDPALVALPATWFCHAQALAALERALHRR